MSESLRGVDDSNEITYGYQINSVSSVILDAFDYDVTNSIELEGPSLIVVARC